MSVDKSLIERLVVVKYLTRQARAIFASSGLFSAGVAVSLLQDAVELFLRVLAEHFHASVKEKTAFDQLVEAVEAAVAEHHLSHRVALNQLNKARVLFKHFGLEPRREDAEKLLYDMEVFLPDNLRLLLHLEYDALSLNSLIEHRRTENWLRESEVRIEAGEYQKAIDAAAIAFAVFRRRLDIEIERPSLDRFGRYRHSELGDLIDSIENELQSVRSQLDLMLTGIDVSRYRVFLRFAPDVGFSGAGTCYAHRGYRDADAPSREHAMACLSFVVDSVLALKKQHIPRLFRQSKPKPNGHLEVISEEKVIVYPGPDPEVLRIATIGEVLEAAHGPRHKDFLPIIENEELAYISRSAVRENSNPDV